MQHVAVSVALGCPGVTEPDLKYYFRFCPAAETRAFNRRLFEELRDPEDFVVSQARASLANVPQGVTPASRKGMMGV